MAKYTLNSTKSELKFVPCIKILMINIIKLTLDLLPMPMAAHLVETTVGPILLETGPHSTLPKLKAGLAEYGYRMEDIKHVFLTHIHLDHAGAAWAFAEHGATIYMHPLGKKHMVDPSKILASAKMIYKEMMDALWGTLKPIPAAQIVTVEHGKTYKVGELEIVAWNTPGHAVHHVAYQIGKSLIAGDVAGAKLKEIGVVTPPCPPPDINIDDWMTSIALLEKLELTEVYLSHFGKITDLVNHFTSLKAILWDWANFLLPHHQKGTALAEIIEQFSVHINQQLSNAGISKENIDAYNKFNPASMNAAGILRYWKKKLEK